MGPRGKTEIGVEGAAGLVRKVYEGSDVGEEDLQRKLNRSLGLHTQKDDADGVAGDPYRVIASVQQTQQESRPRRTGRPRRGGSDDDD